MTNKKTKPSAKELGDADLDKIQGGSKGGNVETTWKVEEGEKGGGGVETTWKIEEGVKSGGRGGPGNLSS